MEVLPPLKQQPLYPFGNGHPYPVLRRFHDQRQHYRSPGCKSHAIHDQWLGTPHFHLPKVRAEVLSINVTSIDELLFCSQKIALCMSRPSGLPLGY